MKTYFISEIYGCVVQGEGLHAGYPCHVLRFSRCNLWEDSSKPSPTCPWCDTPNLHSVNEYSAERLKDTLSLMHDNHPHHGLIITGGEPMLQLDSDLLNDLSEIYPWVDIETNGTLPFNISKPPNVFISCSPKTGALLIEKVDWYKVLIPDKQHLLKKVLERALVEHAAVYLQPVETGGYEGVVTKENIQKCIALCSTLGHVRLSVQLHKIVGVR
jgi:organic radical activating enzyme